MIINAATKRALMRDYQITVTSGADLEYEPLFSQGFGHLELLFLLNMGII